MSPRGAEDRAPARQHPAAAAGARTARATVVGALPGEALIEAVSTLRGELGAPHRSGLPPMPQRGASAETVPRTVSVLTELHCDLQPHGWRIQRHDSKDSRAADSLLAGDLNVLADVIGAETGGDREPVSTELLGPATLAARLHLHNGERVLRDHGARRDLVESMADGIAEHVRAMRQAVDGREIVVRWSEPELQRVLDGAIPTASGYRSLRAVPWSELRGALQQISQAARSAGAAAVELVLPQAADPRRAASTGVDRLVLAAPGPAVADWEPIAALAESGIGLVLRLSGAAEAAAQATRVSSVAAVASIVTPWQDLGLRPADLAGLMVAAGPGLELTTPGRVREALALVADVAHGLQESSREG